MTGAGTTAPLRQAGLVLLAICVLGALASPEPGPWGRGWLVVAAVGMLHAALLGLGEGDPEREVGHLCWIHGSWAALGAAAWAAAPEPVAAVVGAALPWQVLAHGLLVPGLGAWMDRREDDERAADLDTELGAFVLVVILATVGAIAGLYTVSAAAAVDPAAARMAFIAWVLTLGGYVRILTPPATGPRPSTGP